MGEFLYLIMDLQKCCICHLHFNVCYWYCAYIKISLIIIIFYAKI